VYARGILNLTEVLLMNTRFLEAFVWAVRLGSIRGAAERLNMTQAASSSRITSLEDEFGQRLFDRDARKIRLTARIRRAASSIRSC